MKRRAFITLLAGAAGVLLKQAAVFAQTTIPRRVGYLTPVPLPFDDEFRRGLRHLGYVVGENVSIVAPFGGGKDENLPSMAKELADIPVDVIVATNSTATAAAMKATAKIPIVMVTSGDPVGSKFVASLARSGNNVTGLSSMAPEVMHKQLELVRETFPSISRLVVFWNSLNPTNVFFLQRTEADAKRLGLQLQLIEVRTPEDLDSAFKAASQLKPEALLFLIDQVTIGRRADVVKFANTIKCPAMYSLREFVLAGGLMSFGFDFPHLFYRAAYYVDRIFKGATPTELPVQQPIKFQLVLNLATARLLGFTIPTSILLRADEVIE
jgi:putative ABC transport system substrate-binding protein